MADYDNTNTGIVSKNDRKEQDTHPDIRGSINVEGVEYWLDGWRKERKDGSGSFYSLRVKRKDAARTGTAKPSGGAYKAASRGEPADLDDSIPF